MLYAVTSAKMNSFTKAAKVLYVSQSSISQAIKGLEEELKTRLFVRQNNQIFLTEAGQIFVSEASKILEQNEKLKKQIIEFSQGVKKATIHFGISSFYSKYYLPRMMPTLEKKLPKINFNFTEERSFNLEKMVSEETLDFCMVPMPIAHSDLSALELKKERILLAVPKEHEFCRKHPERQCIDLAEVCYEPFVFLKSEQRFSEQGYKLCKQYGFAPRVIYESMNWETIDALVGEGIGLGLVPDVVTNIPGARKPIYYPIDSELATRSYALVYKSAKHLDDDLTSIIECIQKIFEQGI